MLPLSDSDGITDISLNNVKKHYKAGKCLKRVFIHGDAYSNIMTTFVFKDGSEYVASGFSIGYRGTGPRGLFEAIKLFDPSIGEWSDCEVGELSVSMVYEYVPGYGFRLA